MSESATENEAAVWHESGDGHGYVYQHIGPIHYLCECGAYFLNRDRWLMHKAGEQIAQAIEADALADSTTANQRTAYRSAARIAREVTR